MRHNYKLAAAAILALAASGAWAGSTWGTTWKFQSDKTTSQQTSTTVKNPTTNKYDVATASASAYYLMNNTAAGGSTSLGSICTGANTGSTGSNIGCKASTSNTAGGYGLSNTAGAANFVGKTQTAALTTWGSNGLGVNNGLSNESGTPNHAVDNNQRTDMVLFNFGTSSVELDAVTLGYTSDSSGNTSGSNRDADFSVLAYTGAAALGSGFSLAGKTLSDLLTNGWTLISNVDGKDATTYQVNTGNVTSSWWIVSAFNTGYGSASCLKADGKTAGSCDNGDDYFKIASLTGTVHTPPPPGNQVPEPASLALMGLGLLSILAARRRTQRQR